MPYDIGKDQYPSLNKGRSAHHCLVFGFAFATENDVSELKKIRQDLYLSKNRNFTPEKFWLLVRQSKSKRIFLYEPQSLIESNEQLSECGRDQRDFIIPEGGIEKGLAGIILRLARK